MKPIEKLMAGFEIFLNYDGESGDVAWMHDGLCAGGTAPADMVPCDVDKLELMGWRWDESEECWSIFQ